MFVRDTQFVRGANHGIAGHAADLARLELTQDFLVGVTVKQDRARQGEDNSLAAVAHLNIGRSSDNRLRLGRAVIDGGQRQAVGVGMALDGQDLADHNLVRRPDRSGVFFLDVQPLRRRHADAAHAGHF